MLSNAVMQGEIAFMTGKDNIPVVYVKEHSVENCAEVWAARNAILDGANFDDLALRAATTAENMFTYPCNNCRYTFGGLIVIY